MFLEAGADSILLEIKQMERYRRALAATRHKESRLTSTDVGLTYSCWRDADKDSKYKRKMYQFHVIVNASNTILDQIESVTYRLPSSWKDRAVQPITERITNFKLKELAWGSFTLHADVKIKGQDDLVTVSLPITMKEESPRLPV